MKALDLFCGAGGMTLGFMQAGFEVVASIDIDHLAVETHKANFPTCPCWQADLAATSARALLRRGKMRSGDLKLVFGGPPCQGFSEIGHRRKNDGRNALVTRFAELVCELRPDYFVMENVRGLMFPKHRPLVKRFVGILKEGGYGVVDPVRVLDAADYGVPQRRLRTFFLGYRVDLTIPRYPTPVAKRTTVREAIADLPEVGDYPSLVEGDRYVGALGAASAYATRLRRADGVTWLTGCQQTRHSEDVAARFARTSPGSCEPKSRLYRADPEGLSYTLRAGTGPANGSHTAARPIHPWSPRVVTVREAARLHSLPDWFEFHSTKWHSFRQIGNSVPPLLARAVAATIAEAVGQNCSRKVEQREDTPCPSQPHPI